MSKDLRSKKINQIMYISIGCAIIAIIFLVMLLTVFSKQSSKENANEKIGESNNQAEEIIEQASSTIGKKVEETQEYEDVDKNKSVQVQTTNETVATEVKNNNTVQNTENNATNVNTTNTVNNQSKSENVEETEETPKDPTFIMPVEGDVVKQYGKEKLIYSDTLKEWTTHLGIDIKADKTTIVKSSSDGVVKSIKNDPRYGLTVVLEHENGFSSVYSNLLTAEFVVLGENVKSGQTIGTVGNSATFEILDDCHLHFEILKDGNSVDPQMYIK